MVAALVRLFEHIGLGLIIPSQSGVTYTNQTGGFTCLRPEVEGFFVPLRNDLALHPIELLGPEPELTAYFTGPKHRGTGATSGFDMEDARTINRILTKYYYLGDVLKVDQSRLHDSHEAWVYVIILRDDYEPSPTFSGFAPYPRPGILTWGNSD